MADNMTAVQVLIDKGRVIGKLADRALEAKGRECEVLGEVIDLIRKEPEAERRPEVPGHTDAYNIAEMAFHNGEIRMKEKMVDMLLGMRIGADREKHDIIQEILSRVRHL